MNCTPRETWALRPCFTQTVMWWEGGGNFSTQTFAATSLVGLNSLVLCLNWQVHGGYRESLGASVGRHFYSWALNCFDAASACLWASSVNTTSSKYCYGVFVSNCQRNLFLFWVLGFCDCFKRQPGFEAPGAKFFCITPLSSWGFNMSVFSDFRKHFSTTVTTHSLVGSQLTRRQTKRLLFSSRDGNSPVSQRLHQPASYSQFVLLQS